MEVLKVEIGEYSYVVKRLDGSGRRAGGMASTSTSTSTYPVPIWILRGSRPNGVRGSDVCSLTPVIIERLFP